MYNNAAWPDSEWELIETKGSGLGGRIRPIMNNLNSDREIIIFGGLDDKGKLYDDIWLFDVKTRVISA